MKLVGKFSSVYILMLTATNFMQESIVVQQCVQMWSFTIWQDKSEDDSPCR